jgi:formamidopyrimidine-DNA glycosylase
MPELPDITVYIEALESRVVGQTLEHVRIAKPFLLRSVDPPIGAAEGKRVQGVRRMGKRIVLELDGDLFLVIHLMIAGRLRWLPAGGKVPGKIGLAAFDFSNGTLILTEAGSKRRASLWLVRGEESLAQFERGGLEVMGATVDEFTERLTRENHTLKRSLTDPRLFSGIGNAYSDEILHRAKLSPVKHTRRLTAEEIARLIDATKAVLIE